MASPLPFSRLGNRLRRRSAAPSEEGEAAFKSWRDLLASSHFFEFTKVTPDLIRSRLRRFCAAEMVPQGPRP